MGLLKTKLKAEAFLLAYFVCQLFVWCIKIVLLLFLMFLVFVCTVHPNCFGALSILYPIQAQTFPTKLVK